MNILDDINVFRRRLTRALTKDIGKTRVPKNIDLTKKPEINKVLICRPNHRLGNLLLITPLIQEVITNFPNCKIDLFVKGGISPILFENYKNIDHIIQLPKKPFKEFIKYIRVWLSIRKRSYDMAINVVNSSSSGRLATQLSRSRHKLFGDINESIQLKYQDHIHIAKRSVYEFRNYLSKFGVDENNKEIPPLNLKLSVSEITKGQKIVSELVPDTNKKTISIFTYATSDKCYSEAWWKEFYDRLKLEYVNFNIIEVLPVENISQIGFKAASFYSKDVREISAVVANTEVFIGADSGIMHLASSSLTPTVGLFSRVNQKTYQPFGNGSFAINTNTSDIEDWIEGINGILKG
jgi:ADP-heptose:LPS heptosyltransferase